MTESASPSYLPLSAWRPRAPRVAGTSILMAIDETIPGADVYGGINSLEAHGEIPVHWHDDLGEIQFILSGHGVFIDGKGNETPVGPHDVVFAPGGEEGAHGFRNLSSVPLVILFFYPSPGGAAPTMHIIGQ